MRLAASSTTGVVSVPELMKGHTWRDHSRKMSYPAWVEIKYDEIRCHVIVRESSVDFLSYAGKPLANMQKFAEPFRKLRDISGYAEYDTGFQVDWSFDASYRWVRSTRGVPEDLKGKSALFMLFDLPEVGELEYSRRCGILHDTTMLAWNADIKLFKPEGAWAHNEEDVAELFVRARDAGHEGLMVKSMQHKYERGKRSYGWLKVKPENDADGVIQAVHRATSLDGKPLDRAGSVTIRMPDGSTATPHGIPHSLGADMWAHPERYIGQWAEFKYMQRDRQGGYRHPTWGRLREAKE